MARRAKGEGAVYRRSDGRGEVFEFPIPTRSEPSDLNPSGSSGPVAITPGPGPGRTIWFTEIFAGRIGRIDLDQLGIGD